MSLEKRETIQNDDDRYLRGPGAVVAVGVGNIGAPETTGARELSPEEGAIVDGAEGIVGTVGV